MDMEAFEADAADAESHGGALVDADAGLHRGVGRHPVGAGDQVDAGCGFDDVEVLVADIAKRHLAPELLEDGGDGPAADGVLVLGGAEPAEAFVLVVEQFEERVDVVLAVMLVEDVACEPDCLPPSVKTVGEGGYGFVHRAMTFVLAYMNGPCPDGGRVLSVRTMIYHPRGACFRLPE